MNNWVTACLVVVIFTQTQWFFKANHVPLVRRDINRKVMHPSLSILHTRYLPGYSLSGL